MESVSSLFIVLVNETSIKIKVAYARRIRGRRMYGGQATHLPLRLNQAGVIPIIFAISIVLLPSMLGNFLRGVSNPTIARLAQIAHVLTFSFNHLFIISFIFFW